MLVLNIGDKLIGDASDSSVVDYTIHGLVGETLNRFADGQLTDTSADLYVAEDIIVITSIVLVNTDSVSRSINLYIQPNGGSSRHIVAKDLSLDAGCSLHYDGVKVTIVGPYSGAIGLSDHSKLSNLYYDYSGHTGFASSDTLSTVSSTLQADLDSKAGTLLELADTPIVYDEDKYLRSTASGTEWATVSGVTAVHSDLSNLDYAFSGHTGFQPAGDYATDSELTSISGVLQTNIDGKSDTSHLHDDRYYTESEVDNLITTISGKLDDHDELNNLDYASSGHTGFQPAGDYLTDTEFSTYSGTLQIQIDGKSDSGHAHGDLYYTETELNNGQLDTRYYTETEVDNLITAVSGTTDHSVLDNLDYASSGHTGFQPFGNYATDSELTTLSGALKNDIDGKADTSHLHDDRYYTETELDVGQLDNRYYTESEVDTISGSLQNDIDTHGHVSTEITVEKLNTPTYDTLQEWIDNTQSAGRMSGGDTSTHTDAVTGVTVSGAGYGEFKVSGDQTAGYIVGESIRVTDSTNNDGYYIVASGIAHSGGTTTIPVDEAVGAVADGNIVNGTVDVTAGTGFIKITDSDIGPTKSFDIHADTNITLTDITTNYVYVDYNGGNPDIKVTADRDTIEWNRQFPLSMIYRNGARTWVCSCGIYLPNKTRLDHERVLTLRGYERATGGEISEYGTRNIQSTAGIFYRGSNEIGTTSKTSVDDKLTTVYYDGADWVWTENETQVDNTYYNNIATGLVELGVSKYAVHWICIDYLSNLYVVYGRGSYSLSEAQLAGVPSLMPVVANEFGIVAAKVIIQKTAVSFDELISAYTQLVPTATPAVHNNLSGLNEGDYKHLTDTEKTKFDSIDANADVTGDNPPQAHTHDDRYYTESEVDELITTISGKLDDHNELNNLDFVSSGHTGFQPAGDYLTDGEFSTHSGTLQAQIDDKSDIGHTHDDRYYTESEVNTISGTLNTKISAKPDTLLELVDTPAVYDNGKYLRSTTSGVEWTTVSGGDGTTDHSELSNLAYIDAGHTGFSPDTHIHDDRYYTDSEVDTISGSLSAEIDADILTHKGDTDAHHPQTHTIVSHDTTASGSELNTLTDNSIADALHRHSELVASDGSPDPALSVDASGSVGIGTISPNAKLEVVDINKDTKFEATTYSNGIFKFLDAPVFNYKKAYGSEDFPEAVVDGTILGTFNFKGYQNGAFRTSAQIISQVDTTPSGTYVPGELRLITYDNANNNHSLVMRSDGAVGIGTTTPGGKFCVNGGVTVGSDTDAGDDNLRVEGDADVIGNITVSGTVDGVDVATLKSDFDSHDHDDRYYTETEIDTISGTLQTEIDLNTSVSHTQGTDTALGAVGAKNPPIDADKALYRDSTDSDVLVTSTWTQVKAFLKTYFDTLYLATKTIGIADDNLLEVDDADAADDDYAKFTTNGLEGRSGTEVLADLGVESGATADQTKADIDGLAITTVGTLDTGNADAIVTKATVGDINTGTEAIKVVTPDTLAGSNIGTKNVVVKCIADDTALTTGNGKAHFTVPIELNGMDLVSVGAHVYTTSSSGIPTFQIYNLTQTADMLTTEITIDETEYDSKDATTSAVIDTNNDDVATGDVLRFDCDVAGTDTTGMEIRTGFRL